MEALLECKKTQSLDSFYRGIGLENYPFNVYTAENEREYAANIFVHPHNYDAIKQSFDSNRSIIVLGNRGTGKTALLNDLRQSASQSDCLVCDIEDYSKIGIPSTTESFYKIMVNTLVSTLFDQLFEEKNRIKRLKKDDRLFLSMLLSQYTDQLTKTSLCNKIDTIQLPKGILFLKKTSNLVRLILNYGLSAAVNILNDTIRSYFTYIPPITEEQIHSLIPELNFTAETEFNQSEASYNLINKICSIIKKLGYNRTVVFFDKFDEDGRMENNAEVIANFIVPLLTDNKLLENNLVQLIISIWEVPFKRITEKVRTQKHFCPTLSWPISYLIVALDKRLNVFSNSKISSYRELFDETVSEEQMDEIFHLSNGNPRDLWHIIDEIFKAQYSIDGAKQKLGAYAVRQGLNSFVTEFNFYEYYPKKMKAKASTMDIYSYIKHLLKLPSEKFTKNQLNEIAKTGSSTSNYVVGMESMGLITNTKEKETSGVIYRISDPKVVYAIKNHLDISR